ncbi:hypothetical protein SARC_11823 [Sphaeroforma arctica JP610]|uniref:Uncharacterized protein n=1 Tax=Sphaeroforma arctica JP610 TaxID=667725 RepID=A0A0L0FFV6_9EUKA|nr:hypothetical protein SARC_11823 [Sphaeroforma arctica JP610]KNC75657.1 hypothetical protein SARC_11823 [Sphaeroforma arctica JP610]|eukprot:XP_014149559.1 hypothetical protein SARC_11823 [Sphaeroforma arctica JP610]
MANLTASTASMAGANDGTAAASVAAGKGAEKGTNTLLNQLVLAYMSHNGFSKTAETFAKQTGSALRESIESIVARQRMWCGCRSSVVCE